MSVYELVETILAIEPYIDAVILREKTKTDSEMFELVRNLKLANFDQAKIIVHGRADLASLTNIYRLQLPGHGLPLPLLKSHFPALAFGKSVHSHEEAETARSEGADWILYGHLYETDSKTRLPPRGTRELSKMIASLTVPVYTIGGIKPGHIDNLKKLGVAGVAVMSSIFGSGSAISNAKAYYDAINYKKGGNFL